MKKYLSGAALAAVAFLVPELASATNLSTSLTTTASQVAPAITTISYVGYILGAVFVVTGLMKLRAHVDQPAQNPLKDALGRLTVGALLGLTPAVIDLMRNTTAVTSGTGKYSGMNTLP